MAITVQQSWAKARTGGATSLASAAGSQALTNGSKIIVPLVSYGVATYTVTDTAGNTYTQDAQYKNGSAYLTLFSAQNTFTTASNVITAHSTSGSSIMVFGAIEVTGLAASSYEDGTVTTNNGASTGPNTGAFSTTNANDLLIVMYEDVGGGTRTITPPSVPGSYTSIAQETTTAIYIACDTDYIILSSTQSSINPTWTLGASETWYSLAYSYKWSGPPATAYTTALSSSFGTNNDPVTVTFTPNGITTGAITPTTDSTGVFSPTSLTWSGTTGAKTVTYTPSVTGVHHINSTNTAGLSNTSGAQTYNSTTEGVLSITSPTPYQGYQITGSNITFTVTGTYTHSATGDGVVDYSVDGSTWNTLATASAGAFSGTMTIPSSAVANFTLTVRWHTDTISTASVANQILGDVFIWGGDSNASGRGINNQNFTGTTGSVYPTSGGWKIGNDEVNATQTGFPNGTEGNALPLIINELNAWNAANGRSGRGVAVLTCGLSGADCYPSTASWAPGHASYNALTGTQVPGSGVNAVRGVIWSNGPNADAVYAGVTAANYKTAIETMLSGFVSTIGASYGIGGALNAVIQSCGKVTLTGNDVTRQTINAVRSGPLLAVVDGAPASNVVCFYDMALTDPVHWTQDAELLKVAGRYAAEMIRTWFAPSAYPASPSLNTCTYDSNVTITLNFVGANLDSGTPTFNPLAFRVVDNNLSGSITGATNATPIVITSASHGLVTGATITIVGVGGNTQANGQWDVTRIDGNTFSLINSAGNGTYTASTGTWTGGNPATISSAVLSGSHGAILTLAAPTSSRANTRVSLGSGSDAPGLVVPVETPITLASGNTLQRPAQPFFDVTPTPAGGGGGASGGLSGMSGLSGLSGIF